jgi:hypothetical protein
LLASTIEQPNLFAWINRNRGPGLRVLTPDSLFRAVSHCKATACRSSLRATMADGSLQQSMTFSSYLSSFGDKQLFCSMRNIRRSMDITGFKKNANGSSH